MRTCIKLSYPDQLAPRGYMFLVVMLSGHQYYFNSFTAIVDGLINQVRITGRKITDWKTGETIGEIFNIAPENTSIN